ncbi:uncharacterized protein EDB91DRAFT_569572 [Suillus paluster]|uniref:uncharacterized protein n=1 Tax=Suillus paluster TaxID=48578 RepID=UPI001B860D48|nr:uncharacterized protein EDB91DRAFT_569572 [Suillus paluster]KAG1735113.1 hypothetical protein EDB91DRAFT_569572 [Suillus paluster]
MNSFKKLFQRSDDDKMASLKHYKSVPYGLSSEGRTRESQADPFKAVYHGKTPLKASDIVYGGQAPGMLDIHRTQMYQEISDHPPTRAHFNTCGDLLDRFPNAPQPPPKPPRNALRTTSLNSKSIRPQLAPNNYNPSGQHTAGRERILQRSPSVACFSHPTATAYPSLRKKQRRQATADQALEDMLKPARGVAAPILGSSRQAERVRAKSSVGRSYTPAHPPAPPVPPVPTTYSSRPSISRSAHSSRANLRRVPSHVAIPSTAAPDHGQSYWPHPNYREFLQEQDVNRINSMINRCPVAPLSSERTPEHLRPIRFDMENPDHFQKTLSYFIHIAVAQGRPLDARAYGPYRRIVEAGDPTGIVPEVGTDWARQMECR